jgi:hypothetical protein
MYKNLNLYILCKIPPGSSIDMIYFLSTYKCTHLFRVAENIKFTNTTMEVLLRDMVLKNFDYMTPLSAKFGTNFIDK